jgi:hypothetical protein
MTEAQIIKAFYEDIKPKNDWGWFHDRRRDFNDLPFAEILDHLPHPIKILALEESFITDTRHPVSPAMVFTQVFNWTDCKHGPLWENLYYYMVNFWSKKLPKELIKEVMDQYDT